MSDEEHFKWIEKYMTALGWGKGTEHEVDSLMCTVDGYGTNGLHIFVLLTVNGQPQLAQKTVRFNYPDPI